jgi:SNARE protein 1
MTTTGRPSLSSAPTTDGECIDSSEEQLYNDNNVWKSIEESAKHYDWRLPKYVETLEIWLQDLEKHPQGPKKETLGEYKLKVDFLKRVVTTLEEEKLEVESKYINASNLNDEHRNTFPRRKNSVPSHRGSPLIGFNRRQTSPESSGLTTKAFSVLPHGQASTADIISKEIHQKLQSRQSRKIRDELFDLNFENDNDNSTLNGNTNISQSNRLTNKAESNDLDDLLQAHHTAQEKVAEEMLSLTKSLKEQTRVAGEIVRKDTNVMERSNQLAEANAAKLQMESDRLSEHTGSACRCWVWFLLAIVVFTFIAMIMVMKIFRKRRHDEL